MIERRCDDKFYKILFNNIRTNHGKRIQRSHERKKHFEALKHLNLFIYLNYFIYRDMCLTHNILKKRIFHITVNGFFIKQLFPHLYEPNSIFIRKHGGLIGTFHIINDKINLPFTKKCIQYHNKDQRIYRLEWGDKIKKDVIHLHENCPSHKRIRQQGISSIIENLHFTKIEADPHFEILLLDNII